MSKKIFGLMGSVPMLIIAGSLATFVSASGAHAQSVGPSSSACQHPYKFKGEPACADTETPKASAPDWSTAPAPRAAPPTSPSAGEVPYVILAERVRPCSGPSGNCDVPRAARPSTIAADSPTMTAAEYLAAYPQMGIEGYRRTASLNRDLCGVASEYLSSLDTLDKMFIVAGNEYDILQDIYNALPNDIRRGTTVMTIAQAGSAGALCILSAGTYCLAAVVSAGGNIFVAHVNQKLQLANVRLSVANIVVTKLNVFSNRLTLRLDGAWLKDFWPGCDDLGYATITGLPPLPPVPTLPQGFGGHNGYGPDNAPDGYRR